MELNWIWGESGIENLYRSLASFSMVGREGLSMGQSTAATSLFTTIPPERVGLNGEYDHNGLARRVVQALGQQFEPAEIAGLRVSQRGAVVILMGNISSQRLLIRLVNVAMGISGATDVELNGVRVADCLRNYLDDKPSKAALVNLLSSLNACPKPR